MSTESQNPSEYENTYERYKEICRRFNKEETSTTLICPLLLEKSFENIHWKERIHHKLTETRGGFVESHISVHVNNPVSFFLKNDSEFRECWQNCEFVKKFKEAISNNFSSTSDEIPSKENLHKKLPKVYIPLLELKKDLLINFDIYDEEKDSIPIMSRYEQSKLIARIIIKDIDEEKIKEKVKEKIKSEKESDSDDDFILNKYYSLNELTKYEDRIYDIITALLASSGKYPPYSGNKTNKRKSDYKDYLLRFGIYHPFLESRNIDIDYNEIGINIQDKIQKIYDEQKNRLSDLLSNVDYLYSQYIEMSYWFYKIGDYIESSNSETIQNYAEYYFVISDSLEEYAYYIPEILYPIIKIIDDELIDYDICLEDLIYVEISRGSLDGSSRFEDKIYEDLILFEIYVETIIDRIEKVVKEYETTLETFLSVFRSSKNKDSDELSNKNRGETQKISTLFRRYISLLKKSSKVDNTTEFILEYYKNEIFKNVIPKNGILRDITRDLIFKNENIKDDSIRKIFQGTSGSISSLNEVASNIKKLYIFSFKYFPLIIPYNLSKDISIFKINNIYEEDNVKNSYFNLPMMFGKTYRSHTVNLTAANSTHVTVYSDEANILLDIPYNKNIGAVYKFGRSAKNENLIHMSTRKGSIPYKRFDVGDYSDATLTMTYRLSPFLKTVLFLSVMVSFILVYLTSSYLLNNIIMMTDSISLFDFTLNHILLSKAKITKIAFAFLHFTSNLLSGINLYNPLFSTRNNEIVDLYKMTNIIVLILFQMLFPLLSVLLGNIKDKWNIIVELTRVYKLIIAAFQVIIIIVLSLFLLSLILYSPIG